MEGEPWREYMQEEGNISKFLQGTNCYIKWRARVGRLNVKIR